MRRPSRRASPSTTSSGRRRARPDRGTRSDLHPGPPRRGGPRGRPSGTAYGSGVVVQRRRRRLGAGAVCRAGGRRQAPARLPRTPHRRTRRLWVTTSRSSCRRSPKVDPGGASTSTSVGPGAESGRLSMRLRRRCTSCSPFDVRRQQEIPTDVVLHPQAVLLRRHEGGNLRGCPQIRSGTWALVRSALVLNAPDHRPTGKMTANQPTVRGSDVHAGGRAPRRG